MKIVEVEKLAANLHDKKKYVIPTRNLIHTLNYGLTFLKNYEELLNLNKKLC